MEAKGDVIGFVAFKERITFQTAAKRVAEIMAGQGGVSKLTPDPKAQDKSEKVDVSEKETTTAKENQTFSEKGLPLLQLNQDPDLLKGVGVSLEIAQTFGIGFSSKKSTMRGRLLFPIANSLNEVMGYVGKGDKNIHEDDGEWIYPPAKHFNPSLELFGVQAVSGLIKSIAFPRLYLGFDLLKVAELIHKNKLMALGVLGDQISEAQCRTILSVEFFIKDRFSHSGKYPLTEIFLLPDQNSDRRRKLSEKLQSLGFAVRAPKI